VKYLRPPIATGWAWANVAPVAPGGEGTWGNCCEPTGSDGISALWKRRDLAASDPVPTSPELSGTCPEAEDADAFVFRSPISCVSIKEFPRGLSQMGITSLCPGSALLPSTLVGQRTPEIPIRDFLLESIGRRQWSWPGPAILLDAVQSVFSRLYRFAFSPFMSSRQTIPAPPRLNHACSPKWTASSRMAVLHRKDTMKLHDCFWYSPYARRHPAPAVVRELRFAHVSSAERIVETGNCQRSKVHEEYERTLLASLEGSPPGPADAQGKVCASIRATIAHLVGL
jgi:hypothetical protein